MPDIADRHANPQLASFSLRARGIQHARTDDPEFQFADAALHAEQQPIVRQAMIVDDIQICDPCFHKAAKLEKMMPVTNMRARRDAFEAKDSADFTGT